MDSSPTLPPPFVAAHCVRQAMFKHRSRLDIIFFKAVVAGVMLSFGGLLSLVLQGGSPGLSKDNPGLVKILGGAVFPIGLIMIVLQGQELVTSNMMVFPIAVLTRKVPWWSLLVNWTVVFFGNLVGSLFFAAILTRYSGVISAEPYTSYLVSFTEHKAAEPEWHQIFLRGIGCNWLVSVAVWQACGASDTLSKIVAIWLPIWLFVACGFDHVVANMFSIPLGIMFGAPLTAAGYIQKSLIATLIGNIVGAGFVALPAVYFYWPHLQAEFNHKIKDEESPRPRYEPESQEERGEEKDGKGEKGIETRVESVSEIPTV